MFVMKQIFPIPGMATIRKKYMHLTASSELQDDNNEYAPAASSNATTPLSSVTKTKKRKTALSTVVDEIHANAKNDKKFLELMGGLVKSKMLKEANKPLLATDIIMQGLSKLILTFPV